MVLTSNRAVEEWYPLFRDGLMASAAMDRPHRAHVVVMEGHSFRNPPEARQASQPPGRGPGADELEATCEHRLSRRALAAVPEARPRIPRTPPGTPS